MGLMNNTIQIVINLNGSILDKSNAFIANVNENYNAIQIIAPFPVTDSVSVNYDLRKSRIENYTQYLVPLKDNEGNFVKAGKVVDKTKPYYQAVSEWYVWQNYISSKALAGITTWHAGKVYISTNFSSRKPLLAPEASKEMGTFGLFNATTKGDLPITASEGDYYSCVHYSYYSEVADLSFTFGDLAIWYQDKWIKSNQYELRIASQSVEIGIDASILALSLSTGIEDTDPSLTDYIMERISFLEATVYGMFSGVNEIIFNKDYIPINKVDGMLFYDNDNSKHTLTFINEYENGELQEVNLGKDLFLVSKNVNGYLHAGTPVAFTGSQGDHLNYSPASANHVTPELNQMVGVLKTNVNTDQYGPITMFGEVDIADFRNIMEDADDSMLTFGTRLFLSDYQPGKYTAIEPSRPSVAMWVATILKIDTNLQTDTQGGTIFVYPQRLRIGDSGVQIFVSEEEPENIVIDDFWYHIIN